MLQNNGKLVIGERQFTGVHGCERCAMQVRGNSSNHRLESYISAKIKVTLDATGRQRYRRATYREYMATSNWTRDSIDCTIVTHQSAGAVGARHLCELRAALQHIGPSDLYCEVKFLTEGFAWVPFSDWFFGLISPIPGLLYGFFLCFSFFSSFQLSFSLPFLFFCLRSLICNITVCFLIFFYFSLF